MEAPRKRAASFGAGPVPAGDWRAGTKVGGRYVIEEQIGEGASAVTYRARDEVLGRPVALKVLRSRHAGDPEVVARFEREARIAAAISHPNVVAVYDYGSDGGAFFIALQFVSGEDLRSVIDRRGPLDPGEAVRFAGELLAGLGAIHLAGIVHRDIKPSNVLIGRDGVVRLTDFGVAYEVVADRLTSHGTTVGTAAYMAPEQARGGELSPATDLYAVGVVLFELLTGRLPFDHDNPMATLLAQIQTPPPLPSEFVAPGSIPARLEAVVLRALEKDPAARFASAAAMSAALAEATGDPVRSTDTTRLATPVVGAEGTASAPGTVGLANPGGAAGAALGPTRRFGPGEGHPPAVAPRARRRRLRPWLLPLGGAAVALALLGAVVVANSLGDGETPPPSAPGIAGAASPTATTAAPNEVAAIETATATVRSAPTEIRLNTPTAAPPPSPTAQPTRSPTAVSTPTPRPTATRAPTATPDPPTATPNPPTATPPPTVTPRPTPFPTATPLPPTPSPTAVVVEDSPAGVSSGPPAAGVGAGPASGSSAPDDAFLVIPADSWAGGAFRSDVAGRPATLLTRGGSQDRARVSFLLDEVPAAGLTLRLVGFETLTEEPARVLIEINGLRVWEGDSPFAAGEGVVWIPADLPLLAEDFRVGENEIEVRFQAPGGRGGNDASLALGEVRLYASGAATEGGGEVSGDDVVPVEETGGSVGASDAAPTIAPASGG